MITVQPKRWPIETRAPHKQSAVKAARGVAAGSHPSAHKIDNAQYFIRVHASISDGQDATARLPPDQVAEVEFLTWTEDNLSRQVVYEGLREDKPATEVRRPVPHPKVAPADSRTAASKKRKARRS